MVSFSWKRMGLVKVGDKSKRKGDKGRGVSRARERFFVLRIYIVGEMGG